MVKPKFYLFKNLILTRIIAGIYEPDQSGKIIYIPADIIPTDKDNVFLTRYRNGKSNNVIVSPNDYNHKSEFI